MQCDGACCRLSKPLTWVALVQLMAAAASTVRGFNFQHNAMKGSEVCGLNTLTVSGRAGGRVNAGPCGIAAG